MTFKIVSINFGNLHSINSSMFERSTYTIWREFMSVMTT